MSRWNLIGSPACPARDHRAPVVALAFLVFCASGSRAMAQPAIVNEIVDLRYKLREQQAKKEVAEWEYSTLGVMKPPEGSDGFQPTTALRKLLGDAFQQSYGKGPKAAVGAEADAGLREFWRQAETRRVEFQSAVAVRVEEYGFSWTDKTPPPFRLTLLDGLIVFWALVALGMSCAIALHERRRSIRQNARARLPGGVAAILAIGLLALGGCRGSDPASDDPERRAREDEKKAVQNQLATATAEAVEWTKNRDVRYKKRVEDWAKFIEPSATRTAVEQLDAELMGRIRAEAERVTLEEKLAEDVLAVAAMEKDEAELLRMTSAAGWWSIAYAGVRVVAVGILGVLAAVPFWIARRKTVSEIKTSARTCPQCLAVGKLAIQKAPRHGAGDYAESTYLECKSKDREGNECGYRVARSHQYVPRLCFPTVGIRYGGKTHMLTTAYAAIHNRVVPTHAAVQPAPSVMDDRFRQYIELILRHHGEAGGTVHDTQAVPPLLIHTRDTDRWGQNGVLVNLFDYSGELVEETPLAAALRERAMQMNGFMMIFDPTQIYGDGAGVSLEEQIRALANFYQQMAEARGLPPGTLIPNPVAICITKFDLLESQNPIGGQCLPFIQQLDGALKPNDKTPVTLAMMKGRSDLVEQMLPLMFPGVDLGRLVREYFGNQMLYFPMSSVNLNVDEFGRVDTSSRNPAPYGVVEPILWLMHMHGYCVLEAG